MAKKIISFTANKPVQKPTTVQFRTKDGHIVKFKAVETVLVPTRVKFKAKGA